MPLFQSIGQQYLDNNGDPLTSGTLTFHESGTSTLKTVYSDADESVELTNPVTLDASGRQPAIYFTGVAKCTLKDSSGTQIEERDPVGAVIANDDLSDYDSTVTYAIADLVKASDDLYYTSITASNKGNDPTSSAANWMEFKWIFRWNSAYTYANGDFALNGSSLYVSIQDSNLNKNPASEPTWWTPFNTTISSGTNDGDSLIWDTVSGWVANADFQVDDSGNATITGTLTAAKFNTESDGISLLGSLAPADGGTQDIQLRFRDSASTEVAKIGYFNDTVFEIKSLNNSSVMLISGHNLLGTTSKILQGDPDGRTTLYDNGTNAIRTKSGGGAEVYDGASWADIATGTVKSNVSGVVTSDQSTTTTPLADCTGLTATLTAGWWRLDCLIIATSTSSAPDLKWDFNYTGTLTSSSVAWDETDDLGQHSSDNNEDITTNESIAIVANREYFLRFSGFANVADGGTFSFRFGQNTSDAAAVTIKAGSNFVLTQLD